MIVSESKLAIVAAALTDQPRLAPRLARSAGFAGLLFDAFTPQLVLPDLSISGRREFCRVLAGDGQQLVGLRADLDPRGFGPGADLDRALDRLDLALEAAASLGAPLLCVDLGPLPIPARQPQPKPAITPAQAGRIILLESFLAAPASETTPLPTPSAVDPVFTAQVNAALRDLGQRADRYGVTLALRSELSSFTAIAAALESADCPCFGLDLDPVAILRDDWSLEQVLSRLGPLLRHIRARDALRGADRRTQPAPVGQGSVEWASLLANLDQAGYSGWITIDPIELPNRLAAAAAARNYLVHIA